MSVLQFLPEVMTLPGKPGSPEMSITLDCIMKLNIKHLADGRLDFGITKS